MRAKRGITDIIKKIKEEKKRSFVEAHERFLAIAKGGIATPVYLIDAAVHGPLRGGALFPAHGDPELPDGRRAVQGLKRKMCYLKILSQRRRVLRVYHYEANHIFIRLKYKRIFNGEFYNFLRVIIK